jgi:hypothetical protein
MQFVSRKGRLVLDSLRPHKLLLNEYQGSRGISDISIERLSIIVDYYSGRARWSSGQCAWHAIAEAKHRYQWLVLGWVTKIYYLELLCASEGTLSRWSRLHLQSLAPTPVSRRVDVRQAAGRKNNCRIFITT